MESHKIPESSLVLSKAAGGQGYKAVHLLVVGLAGAGKSTFISKATADDSIPIGASIFGVTTEVQEYVLYVDDVEVHLIDTPGFDDAGLSDHEILHKISVWMNTIYSQQWRIGGFIHIFDITRARLGLAGEVNIRMLEAMTGKDRFKHISLVTSKWQCSADHNAEIQRETELSINTRAWGALIQGTARLCRFENTEGSAKEIIRQHIHQSFEPEIVRQMADPTGPGMSLGSTDAGRIISNNIQPKLRSINLEQQQRIDEVLGYRFDAEQAKFMLRGMMSQLAKARREAKMQKVGRWALRLSMVGGSVIFSLLAENPSALGAGFIATKWLEKKLEEKKNAKEMEITQLEEAMISRMNPASKDHQSSN